MPKPSSSEWQTRVVELLGQHADRPLKARALAKALDVDDDDYPAFRGLLREMLSRGELVLGAGRTIRLPDAAGIVHGIFRANRRGFGFVESPGKPDLFIPAQSIGGALDGDRVAARRVRSQRADQPRGEVLRVLSRNESAWVGKLRREGSRWLVSPQGRTGVPDIQIDDPAARDAAPGDLVVIEPLPHTLRDATPRGVIIERIGPVSETRSKIIGVARRFELREAFDSDVRDEAHRVASTFDPQALDDRVDLRDLPTITIDPPDARDFDDAISIEVFPGGISRLGVHIADVAAFIEEGSPLDEEAKLRGNSVYFPRHVVPMLPEVLSNGVCSLQPDQPRYTLSAFIRYDASGNVLETEFARSIIQSRDRLTYLQAARALDGDPDAVNTDTLATLRLADRLARRIRARRIRAGMVTLQIPEVEIVLDAKGAVRDAAPADASFPHTIIEMFMVEANEAVSRFLTEREFAHLRRVHPPPDPDAAGLLGRVLRGLGHSAPRTFDRPQIQGLLKDVRGKPEESTVSLLLLRSMSRAFYAPGEEGHFALASEAYCHFTSPIRRYPDLTIHRALVAALRGERADDSDEALAALVEMGEHCSETERNAQDAEREVKQMLLAEFLAGHVGDEFDAVLTGVVASGVFAQIKSCLADGFIPVAALGGDFWRFESDRSIMVGARSGRVIAIGQPLRVIVESVDLESFEVRLRPAGAMAVGQQKVAMRERREQAHKMPRKKAMRRGKQSGSESRRSGKSRAGAKKRGHQGP